MLGVYTEKNGQGWAAWDNNLKAGSTRLARRDILRI